METTASLPLYSFAQKRCQALFFWIKIYPEIWCLALLGVYPALHFLGLAVAGVLW
jgi:hypothetical protein